MEKDQAIDEVYSIFDEAIEKALELLEKYEGDPEVNVILGLIEEVEDLFFGEVEDLFSGEKGG